MHKIWFLKEKTVNTSLSCVLLAPMLDTVHLPTAYRFKFRIPVQMSRFSQNDSTRLNILAIFYFPKNYCMSK